jgi:cytochrome P450
MELQAPPAGKSPHPPRPPWSDFGHLHRLFGRDLLGGLAYMHSKYGDFVRTRLPLHIYFLAHPDAIEEVLVKKPNAFRKHRTTRLLARVSGNGLLANEGESWRQQRRLLQPAFHQQHLQTYAALMVGAVERAAAGWRAGEVRDVHQDMMGVTMTIVAGTLFGTELSANAERVGHAITDLMAAFERVMGLAARVQPPTWVPTPGNRRILKSRREIDALILGIIEARKRDGAQRDDLLSLLIQARDEDGGGMSDSQVRDEAVTLFLAGHETTALALSYALYLLASHPAQQAQIADEVARVLGGRSATFEDLPALSFTENVVLETMRLYPPAWGIAREALEPVEIAGFPLPRGAELIMSPFIVHRDPRWFPDPESFDPDRWRDDLARRLPRFAYFPFGGGPRVCIGNRFAMMEAKLVLAGLIQRFRFETTTETSVTLQPSATLRPRDGVRLRLTQRQP